MNANEAVWTSLWEQAQELGPDPELEELSDEEVEAEVRQGAARIAALTCRWLVHVAELVVRGVWAEDGASTPGQWLSWRCGVASATAREHVRVGLALRNAPRVRERFAAGTLSYSKVRAITRVVAPETEDMLLDLADAAPASQLERIIAGCRHQLDERERWAEGPPDLSGGEVRDFRRIEVDPTTVEYRIRMTPADAVAFDARVERLVAVADRDAQPSAQQRLEESEDAEPSVPDGHVPLAVRRAIAVGDALAKAVADGAPDRSGADDHLVVVHLGASELAAAVSDEPASDATDEDVTGEDTDRAASAETPPSASAETPASTVRPSRRHVVTGRGRGMSLPRSVIARLACEAELRVAGITEHDNGTSHPADIGRRSRKVPADLRRAMLLRDRHCRFPGCHRSRRLHAHHVWHWADGGPTDLANLVAICSFHHRFVHDAGWTLRPVDPLAGRWSFHAPDSPGAHPAAPPLDGASAETAADVLEAPHPRALEPPWWDGAYDLDLTIGVITDALDDLAPEPVRSDRGPHPWLTTAA